MDCVKKTVLDTDVSYLLVVCSGAPAVMLAFVKHLWATGNRKDALLRLNDLVGEIAALPTDPPAPFVKPDLSAYTAVPGGLLPSAAKR